MKKNSACLSIKEAAEYLNICESKMRVICHSDGFPLLRLGKRLLVPRRQLDLWIETQTTNNKK